MNSKSLFGETLKSIRKQTDMTQKDAASFLSISRQQYSHLENGHRLPSVEMIVRIATLYNLNPLELMLPLIPENVALDNPDTAYYLKNGMFTYPAGKPAFDAAWLGAEIHARSGLLAAEKFGNSYSVMAGDILDSVAEAITFYSR